MSSAVVSTSAALGRPFVFDDVPDPHVGTAALACPERSRRACPELAEGDCPVERSSTARREHLLQSSINNAKIPPSSVIPASRLEIRPAPEMVSSGVSALDSLTGGLPRGCLTEICGPASSGRTSLLLAALAAATRRGEFCVVVDATDSLDPHSAAAAGVEMDHLLWIRCSESSGQELKSEKPASISKKFSRSPTSQSENSLEQVLRATDLLLESGGFGLIILDLGDIPTHAARRIPLTTWFRFRRAVENKSTILMAIEQQPIAGSCSSLLLQLGPTNNQISTAVAQTNQLLNVEDSREPAAEWRKYAAPGPSAPLRVNSSRGLDEKQELDSEEGKKIRDDEQSSADCQHPPTHAHLLTGLEINAELIRSRLERKPATSIAFATKTAWAG